MSTQFTTSRPLVTLFIALLGVACAGASPDEDPEGQAGAGGREAEGGAGSSGSAAGKSAGSGGAGTSGAAGSVAGSGGSVAGAPGGSGGTAAGSGGASAAGQGGVMGSPDAGVDAGGGVVGAAGMGGAGGVAAGAAGSSAGAGGAVVSGLTVDQLVYDHMGSPTRSGGPGSPWGKHESGLHGVPSNYDWAEGARPGMWTSPNGKQAVTTWGQVYEASSGSPVKNIRVQIRNHKLYAYAGGKWTVMEEDSEALQGSRWQEDFGGVGPKPPTRVEPAANGGGRSFVPASGYNLHWWTSKWPRPPIPAGLQAFYIVAELRLIPDADPNVNLANAKYLAGVSADYYATTTEAGQGPFPSLSISRHKWLSSQWKTFTAYIGGGKPTSVDGYRADILSRPLPPGVSR